MLGADRTLGSVEKMYMPPEIDPEQGEDQRLGKQPRPCLACGAAGQQKGARWLIEGGKQEDNRQTH